MPHIIVDDEQARLIVHSDESIEVRDRTGKHLGYVSPGFSSEDIAMATQRKASEEPRHQTQHVIDHLDSLER